MHFPCCWPGEGGNAFAPAEKTELCSLPDWALAQNLLTGFAPSLCWCCQSSFCFVVLQPSGVLITTKQEKISPGSKKSQITWASGMQVSFLIRTLLKETMQSK